MKNASSRSVFNDGEVVIQSVLPKTSIYSRLPLCDEADTEEITRKLSPLKTRPKGAALTGLGKCSRVAFSRGPTTTCNDDSNDTDEEEENIGDVSTFVRLQKKTTSSTVRSGLRAASAVEAETVKHITLTEPILGTNLSTRATARSKNFVMDSKMKNFDPAEWRKIRATQKTASTTPPSIVVDDEVKIVVQAFPLPLSPSPVVDLRSHSLDNSDDDEIEEQETRPLDISVCETKKIDIKSTSARSTDSGSEIIFKNQLSKSTSQPSSSTISIPSSSSSSFISSNKRSNEIAESASVVYATESDGDDNCPKRRKRVSFAGNPEPHKRTMEQTQGLTRLRSKSGDSEGENVILTLKDTKYTRLNVLGKGGSSCVYRVMSQSDSQLYAYKRVDVKGSSEDSEAVFDSYINEIELLRRLKGSSPYIIDLVDAEVNREGMYIAIVMEAGEVDLAKVLSQKQKQSVSMHPHQQHIGSSHSSSSSSSGVAHGYTPSLQEGKELLNPFFVRMVWQEMLEAVDHIHKHRIVHGDLKPANFVFVKGHLKLIDFGIAKAFSNDTTNIYRESQIGTVNYMAPEAIAPYSVDSGPNSGTGNDEHEGMSMRLGRASDIWSLGCILYQMLYARPPFAALTTIQKLHAIPNPKYAIQYPKGDNHVDWDAVGTIKACLERDPRKRATIRGEGGLLSMPYLSVEAMRCSLTEKHKQTQNSDVNIVISKEKVRCAVQSAVQSLQGRRIEPGHQLNEKLFEEIWQHLSQKTEGQKEETEVTFSKNPDFLKSVEPLVVKPADVVSGNSKVQVPSVLSGVGAVDIAESVTPSIPSVVVRAAKVTAATSTSTALVTTITSVAPIDNKENNPQLRTFTQASSGPRIMPQAARVVVVNAAAEIAKRRTVTPYQSDIHSMPLKIDIKEIKGVRPPLRTLPTNEQDYVPNKKFSLEKKPESRGQSPDRQDPKSVLEKRIGAMRKFLDEEQCSDATGTCTVDCIDGGSFF